MVKYAPILLFIYNRPKHLEGTINGLVKCKNFRKHDLIVIGDGPKNKNDEKNVFEARKIAKHKLDKNTQFIFSKKNKGLSKSIIDGVTNTINKYEKAIIIEDDLKLHESFLEYMQNALDFFQDNDQVYSVSGYAYKDMNNSETDEPMFLPFISTWGWGTWKSAWETFDHNSKGSEKLFRNNDLRHLFDVNGVYPFSDMLESQKQGRVDSWGIRWYWTLFNQKKLCCYPRNSLVINDGYDNEATNGRGWANNFNKKKMFIEDIRPTKFFNKEVKVDEMYYHHVTLALFQLNGGYFGYMKDKIKRLFKIFDK